MKRLIEKTVFCALVTAWRFAAWPTSRSLLFVNATTDGVVRAPSEFSKTTGSPPSITAIQELVVPKSIPKTLAIKLIFPLLSIRPLTTLKLWRDFDRANLQQAIDRECAP